MPVKKSLDLPNLDDLLEPDAPEESLVSAPEEATEPAVETETPAARRIRELRDELDREEFAPTQDGRPLSEAALTAEQREVRDLEDQLARKRARVLENSEPEYARPSGTGETILIHFLVDGFNFGGKSWYRGQEVEFEVGSPAYEQTKDRNGNTWLDLRDDIDGQFDRWGKQFFAVGPWRGRRWNDTKAVSDPEEARALADAAALEAKRNRAAPVLPTF